MTFKELLEKYKNGTATPEERAQVEQELEKYEALSAHFLVDFELEEEPQKNEAEWKRIRSRMKKRNILLAAAVVLVAAVSAVAASWSSIMMNAEEYLSSFWYDPESNDFGEEFSNDLTLALEVATELHMPEYRTEYVSSERTGAGRYELSIQQWENFEGKNRYCFGTVDRNEIRLNNDFRTYVAINGFANSDPYNEGVQTPKEEIMQEVGMLPEYVQCETYVSFGEDVSMETMAELMEKYDLYSYWVGVRVEPPDEQTVPLVGFNPSGSGYIRSIADEKYPFYEISLHDEEEPLPLALEEHFKAVLRVAMDDAICPILEKLEFGRKAYYQEMLDYVEENGVKSYGFIAPLNSKEIELLTQEEAISGFYITDMKLDIPWE